jgi:hypothetical protein
MALLDLVIARLSYCIVARVVLPCTLNQTNKTVMKYPGRVIQRGEPNKTIVKAIQKQLNAKGCGPIALDGDFGKITADAVKLFQTLATDQQGNALVIDGKLGSISWAALFGITQVPSNSGTPKKTLVATALDIAISQIGVREVGGANSGPKVKEYLASVNLAQGAPWCMAFVYWCYSQAATQLNARNPLVQTGHVLTGWRNATCTKISSADAINNPALVKPGQIFIIDHGGGRGHTGIVKSVEGGFLTTIEGNSNDAGSREGIGVFKLNRRKIVHINKGFLQY